MTTKSLLEEVPFAELRSGDLIVAIDGYELPAPREVAVAPEEGHARLVNALGTVTEWNLYHDQVERVLTVRRGQPEQAPVPEPDTRVVDDSIDVLRVLVASAPRIRLAFDHPLPSKGNLLPPGARTRDREPRIGDVVLIPVFDYWQVGVVVGVGPKRVRVTYSTPYGLKNPLYLPTPTTYAVRAVVYVVTGESWTPPALDRFGRD